MLSRYIVAFIRAIYDDWKALMSGIASILLSVLAAVGPTKLPHWAFWLAAGFCLLLACFRVWTGERREREALEKRVEGFPNLILISDGFRITKRILLTEPSPRSPAANGTTRKLVAAVVASLTFANEPKSYTEESVAKGVTALVTIRDAGSDQILSQCAGRWIPEAGDISLSEEGLRTADFLIGGTHTLGIAMKLFTDYQCYAFDPNPCWYPNQPAVAIKASEFRAVIRLRCPYFDRSWTVRFRDLGHKKGLKALSI
jgi:hypothetical protein